jgi:hypothetical protein
MSNSKRRKIENENRTYQERWKCEYLITTNNGKLQCLVCMQVSSVPNEFASYTAALEQAKSKKPFSDGSLVKKSAFEMTKAFCDSSMAKEFETVSLSHQTVARTVAHMDEHVRSRL